MTRSTDYLGVIDAVVYGDAFDCAITFDELHRYGRVRVTREELGSLLASPILSQVVGESDGYYFLAGRSQLAGERAERQQRAQVLRCRALRLVRILQYAPFVRGILLTGSVAAEDATAEADLDMLIIIGERRLALAFTILAPLPRLVSRRLFCPNYYLSERHQSMPKRNYYVAREIAQAETVSGPGWAFWENNGWVAGFLPNAKPRSSPAGDVRVGRLLQRLVELPFRGRFGEWLEGRARRLALARLAAHHRRHCREIPRAVTESLESEVELRFHGDPRVDRMLQRYWQRRAEVASVIESLVERESRRTAESAQ